MTTPKIELVFCSDEKSKFKKCHANAKRRNGSRRVVAGDTTFTYRNVASTHLRRGAHGRETGIPLNLKKNFFHCRKLMGVVRPFSFILPVLLLFTLPKINCFPQRHRTELSVNGRIFGDSGTNGSSALNGSVGARDNKIFFVNLKDVNNSSVNLTSVKESKLNSYTFGKHNSVKKRDVRFTKRHSNKKRTKQKPFFTDEVQNYLTNFGYLPPSDRETGLLRTEDQLRDALKNLQSFANIPVTGELDNNTLELLKKPRCGLPDFNYYPSGRKRRYTLHGQKWHYTNLTWSLRTLQPRNLDGGQVRRVLHHALDVWARHSRLTFRELNSDRADILVYFHSGYHGDGYAFDGRGQVLAHAFFPGKERGGDAHFDEDEIWLLDPYADLEQMEGTSLFAVAAHEFGHSLGLSHSSVQGALMFPWYQGYEGLTPDLQLPDDDRHAIQQLYGAKETKWAKIPLYGPHQPGFPRPETPRPHKPSLPHSPTRSPVTSPPRPWTPRPTEPPPPPPPPSQPPRPPYTHPQPHPHPYPHPRPNFPEKSPEKPDTCNTSYDAISIIRNEVFIFKNKYLWRIDDRGLKRDYPAEITRLWYGFPPEFSHVDAVYERNDKKIVFFIGKLYYVFNANYLMPGYPKPIHYLGLPKELEKIDAAMVWGHNGKTYFFSGTMYWRFDEDVGRVELDYPRDMSMWRGVGYNIDAVFQWKDGKTYFFKNKGFWKFNDMRMRVENERQTLSAPFWMGCPKLTEEDDVRPNNPTTKRQTASSSSSSSLVAISPSILISIYLIHCLLALLSSTINSYTQNQVIK